MTAQAERGSPRQRLYKYDKTLVGSEIAATTLDGQVIALVPGGARVLEIGCATGYLADYLTKERGCRVVGVELDAPSAELARTRCEAVVTGDIQDGRILDQVQTLAENGFDLVLMIAVLEHLSDPTKVLRRLGEILAPDGHLVATLPNVAHWTTRIGLLRGRFEYQDYGIMDRTHLRFYTRDSARRLLEDAGYRIESESWDGVGFRYIGGFLRRLPLVGRRLHDRYHRLWPSMFGYQFLYRARFEGPNR